MFQNLRLLYQPNGVAPNGMANRIQETSFQSEGGVQGSRSPGVGSVMDLGSTPISDRVSGYQLSMQQFFDGKMQYQRSAPETRQETNHLFRYKMSILS